MSIEKCPVCKQELQAAVQMECTEVVLSDDLNTVESYREDNWASDTAELLMECGTVTCEMGHTIRQMKAAVQEQVVARLQEELKKAQERESHLKAKP